MVGRAQRFHHRHTLNVESYGQASLDFLLSHDFVPAELRHNYQLAAETLITHIQNRSGDTGFVDVVVG